MSLICGGGGGGRAEEISLKFRPLPRCQNEKWTQQCSNIFFLRKKKLVSVSERTSAVYTFFRSVRVIDWLQGRN